LVWQERRRLSLDVSTSWNGRVNVRSPLPFPLVSGAQLTPLFPFCRSSAVVQGKINKICDAVRGELEKTEKDMIKYVDSILTAHVVKTPPDHEEALRMLHRLKGQHPKVVEDAIKYVIFL